MSTDTWSLAEARVNSRLLLGTAQYPSPETMADAIRAGQVDVVTVALRRQAPEDQAGERFWELVKKQNVRVLPNTAGCQTPKEAVATAQMARELFGTPWIKLEVIGDEYTLQPDSFGLIEAARILVKEGFEVFPYMTDDLVLAHRLVDIGCRILMPWAAPIGSGQGLLNPCALKTLRQRLPNVTLIVDAGLGKPSHAAQVLEMGYDAVLVNSAVALAQDPVMMAQAFAQAVNAGRRAFKAGVMATRDFASPSTPTLGMPFWQQKG